MRAQLRTLGAFDLRIDGRAVARPSTQKARALLAHLCLRQGSAIAREEIVEEFWPESQPDNARQSLKTALWSIRRVVRDAGADPNDYFTSDHFTVAWHAPTLVDAAEFERLARAGDSAALEVYSGDFLPGDYDDWSAAQRERLIGLLESLLSAVVLKDGDTAAAARLIQIDPFNEPAYAALIDAELGAQRRVGAQMLLERFRKTMHENGLTPSPAFEARFASVSTASSAAASSGFVGRQHELAAFETVLRSRQRAVLVVHGDAGFGKTALLEQFKRRAAAAGHSIVSLGATSEKSGFGGWEEVYRDRVGAAIETLAGERGSNLSNALVEAIAQTIPAGAYVFVDDAHRLEGDSAYVTAALLEATRSKGVAFVLATRPEGLRAVLSWCKRESGLELPLSGLTEGDVRTALGERGDERLAAALFARTGGHPLFLQRVLERTTDGPPPLDMPEGVRALIEERLRERGEDAYAVAGLLAIDRRFGSDELAAMLHWDEARVLDAVDDLLALGIVRESATAELEFTHDVVMEVARDSCGPQRRKRFHRMAAAMLEGAARLSDMARAAAHKAAAGEPESAAQLYLRCSRAANGAYEHRNALALAFNARTQAEQLDRTEPNVRLVIEIDAARIRALNATADSAEAERIASAAIGAARSLGDRRLLFETIILRMRARMRGSSLDAIVEDARDAMTIAQDLGDRGLYAEAALGMLQTSLQRVNESDALEYGRRAFEAAIESGDADLAVFVSSELIHAEAIFWKFPDAMATVERAEKLLRSASGTTEPNFQYSVAQLMYVLDAYDEAERRIVRALDVLEGLRAGLGRFVPDRLRSRAILTNMRGLIAVANEDWITACASADAFAANPAASPATGIYPHVVDLQVRALLGRNGPGDVDRAEAWLESVARANLVEDTRMYVDVGYARLAARRRDPEAPRLLERALASALETASLGGLDVDRVLADVAGSARECGAVAPAAKAGAEAERYVEKRRLAAGPYWRVGLAALRGDRPLVL